VFLLCREHDPCSLYLGAMITGVGIFIECEYGSHAGIATTTLIGYIIQARLHYFRLSSILG
jgi:hypothetical protein